MGLAGMLGQGVEPVIKAYAVTENYENTGGILFAKHAVVARRLGACEWGDGEFGNVSCRRAKWADECADTGIIPASVCIWAGWNFECGYCGHRIDRDYLPYPSWTPNAVIGHQNGSAFCDKACHLARKRQDDYAESLKKRVFAHYSRRLERRLPGIAVHDLGFGYRGSHIYVAHNGRVEQVVINFDWPGQEVGPASFRWSKHPSGAGGITCCFGDKDAFEVFAKATQP